ncbi:unnamed protein product [Phaedon cochleariae]|uniref:Protein kinase domain-containing protein n=1 Tax=Phaedon cochleariae TaxID=80249 RepID=A0A9N9X5S4_PHACE|nr:unnamed protein product [Phaedon cochleariae]
MSPYKKNQTPGKNRKPADNDENGTAWLSRPDKLFKSNQPSTVNSSSSKSKDTNNINDSHQVDHSTNGSNNLNVGKRETKKHDNKQYLALIEKVVKNFQGENDTFVDVMKNILDVTDSKDVKTKLMKYDFINTLLVNLSESSFEEIAAIKEKVAAILVPVHMKHLYVEDSSMQVLHPLGAGASGIVYLGFLEKPKRKIVAVKKSINRFYDKMIENEAWVMSQLQHENIVQILAIKRNMPEIAIELMEFGNFVDAAEKIKFSKENLVQIFKDIASGMEYIHSKDFLHRDLAARNVFINGKKRCKIGDFGTGVYVGNTKGVFHEKTYTPGGANISPETLMTQLFTEKTDVWAMGVLILDAFLISSEECRLKFSMRGLFMQTLQSAEGCFDKPGPCPATIFLYCKEHLLNLNANNRPNFTAIKGTLQEILDQKKY